MRELLKLTLVMNSKENRVTLSSLYDRIEKKLRSLETLGVAIDKYAAMLFPSVESYLLEVLIALAKEQSYQFNTTKSQE